MNIRWPLFGCAILGLAACAEISGVHTPPQTRQMTVMDLGMERYAIARPDETQWIFSGSGKCSPRRWTMTGFDGGLGYRHNSRMIALPM